MVFRAYEGNEGGGWLAKSHAPFTGMSPLVCVPLKRKADAAGRGPHSFILGQSRHTWRSNELEPP